MAHRNIEEIANQASLTHLDQSKILDRVDHFCFGRCLVHSWQILLMDTLLVYSFPWNCGGSDQGKIETFHVVQIYLRLSSFYPYCTCLCWKFLEVNRVLCKITLPGTATLARYFAYANNIFTLVISNAKIEEISKRICSISSV